MFQPTHFLQTLISQTLVCDDIFFVKMRNTSNVRNNTVLLLSLFFILSSNKLLYLGNKGIFEVCIWVKYLNSRTVEISCDDFIDRINCDIWSRLKFTISNTLFTRLKLTIRISIIFQYETLSFYRIFVY